MDSIFNSHYCYFQFPKFISTWVHEVKMCHPKFQCNNLILNEKMTIKLQLLSFIKIITDWDWFKLSYRSVEWEKQALLDSDVLWSLGGNQDRTQDLLQIILSLLYITDTTGLQTLLKKQFVHYVLSIVTGRYLVN